MDALPIAVAQLFFSLPESRGYAVGGGMAAIAYTAVERGTEDIDLFLDRRIDGVRPGDAAAALQSAALARGWSVEIVRSHADHARLAISDGGLSLLVDLGLETVLHPPTPSVLGPTLDERDVAVGKLVALFDRAEARDFVDVFAFSARFDRDELLMGAMQRDIGLRLEHLAERIDRILHHLDPDDLPSSYRSRFDEIRDFFRGWQDDLRR